MRERRHYTLQKNVRQKRLEHSEIPGERFFIDISSLKMMGIEGYRNWLLCVDDCTDMPFSFFISEKGQLEESFRTFFSLISKIRMAL